ncbi:unnamed protein product [Bursaphelenchus xylophilus]|uniref:(pine wood nematode) hypothetical protein n=1 Tax=Bursaphelenchus xylophilus TaxID=6326 RepID=A0A1I7RMA6_BURXY|nr:unnamed protein product [Bursaphelenchus xylophilus]CAG9118336.1 unnamed protein product [Bursaphelenchus xylophilus]
MSSALVKSPRNFPVHSEPAYGSPPPNKKEEIAEPRSKWWPRKLAPLKDRHDIFGFPLRTRLEDDDLPSPQEY